MEVRGQRSGVKLPHHQRDLTSMISGMVRQMLHHFDLCCAKRKHCFPGFVCHPIHELDLFFLNFLPPYLQRSNVGECMRIEQGVSSRSQICQEGGAMGRRLLSVRKPNPLAADDVHERVSHGTKGAAQIARELLSAECANRLQNPVVRPAVELVK